MSKRKVSVEDKIYAVNLYLFGTDAQFLRNMHTYMPQQQIYAYSYQSLSHLR